MIGTDVQLDVCIRNEEIGQVGDGGSEGGMVSGVDFSDISPDFAGILHVEDHFRDI